jgi:hypothetical protein
MNGVSEVWAWRLSAGIVAVGVVIGALEDWKNRREFAATGLMAWEVAELEWSPPRFEVLRALRRLFFGFRTFQALLLGRILGGFALLMTSLTLARPVPALSALLLLAVAIGLLRCAYGADGADQMNVVVLCALTIAGLFPEGDVGRRMAFWFVAAQLSLSYVVAGVAKAVSRSWWDGSGLAGVLSTHGYGAAWCARLFDQRHWLAAPLGWAVVVFESTFFAAWLVPWPWGAAYLAMGAIFHLAVGALMGLNTFVFAFLAAYPLAWFCMQHAR